MKLAGESEGEGGATAILLPRMQGVDIQVLKTSRKALGSMGNERNIQDALGIVQTADVKCVLLFSVGNTSAGQFIPVELQKSFRDTKGWDPVIAGAVADSLLSRKELTK